MKKFLFLIGLSSILFAQTKIEIKDTFVDVCYNTAQNESAGVFEATRLSDYCKCVFDVASANISVNDLIVADKDPNSRQSKIFLDNVNKSVGKCTYNIIEKY